jgi:hypothetical protein
VGFGLGWYGTGVFRAFFFHRILVVEGMLFVHAMRGFVYLASYGRDVEVYITSLSLFGVWMGVCMDVG